MFLARGAIALLLLCGSSAPVFAAAPDHADASYLKDAVSQTVRIATSPAHWERSDWLEAGGVAAVAAGFYAGADVWAQHAALRNQSRVADGFATVGRDFGNGFYTVAAAGGAYLVGEKIRDRRLRRASLDAVESLAISGLFVTGIKVVAGRDRPYVGEGRGTWNGPSTSESRYSFPSGHSAAAFSVATAYATEYGDVPGVAPAAYGLATLTGVSRVYNDRHWASDVFVGAALGYFTAKSIARAHRDSDEGWSLRVFPAERGAGAIVVRRF